MNHEELRDSIPALALNALSKGEQVLVETHVSVCTGCSFEYREYQEVAALLAHLVPAVAPPPGLWDRIEEGLAEQVRPAPTVVPFSPGALPTPDGTPGRTRRRGRFSMQRVAALGAAALLVVGGASIALLNRSAGEGPPGGQRDEQQLFLTITSSPHAVVPMQPTPLAQGASGEIFVASDGKVAVSIYGLPSPGSQTYALWLMADGRARPLGDLRPDASGDIRLATSRTVGHSPKLVVTLESKPGNSSPDGPPILNA